MLVGKHGDHIGGERDAARALMPGERRRGCMIDGNHLSFTQEGHAAGRAQRACSPQTPAYDHCNFTVLDAPRRRSCERFRELLLGMSYDDPAVRPLLDLEGLKEWRPGRTAGYALLDARRRRPVRRRSMATSRVAMTASEPRSATSRPRRLGLDEAGICSSSARCAASRAEAIPGVRAARPELGVHLRAWCRAQGHAVRLADGRTDRSPVPATRGAGEGGDARRGRRRASRHAGRGGRPSAAPRWGLAARGATGRGGRARSSTSACRQGRRLGRRGRAPLPQAAAAQWDPDDGASPWDAPFELPDEVEDAVVQVMTYLIENETAALLVPARFLGADPPALPRGDAAARDPGRRRGAPHRGVHAPRAAQAARRRALSTVGGQASLKTLVDEPDFALASFLLSVLGEGTFLALLWFLREHAPDPVTREVARLAAQDEARHVAFGLAHLARQARMSRH